VFSNDPDKQLSLKQNIKINWPDGELVHNFYVSPQMGWRSLLEQAIRTKNTLRHCSFSGTSKVSKEEFSTFFAKFEGHLFYNDDDQHLFMWPDGIAQVTWTKTPVPNGTLTFSLMSANLDFVSEMKKWGKEHVSKEKQKGEVFAVSTAGQNELELVRIGTAGAPFEAGNYAEGVVKDYKYIIEQFQSDNPSGRIVILEGNPGTGKTYFVRGLLDDLSKCLCVTIPPGTIAALGNPDFVPLLLRHKKPNQPIVLIVEDADQCLTARNKDNMASISSLLNLGDGIFGSAFDIRIICTTNANLEEIDPAVLRDGRLCRRSEVGPLSAARANEILTRLIPEGTFTPFTDEETPILATAYKRAQESGWKPPKKPIESLDEDEDVIDY